ncbi:hypothetical protein LBMAG25_19110 [Bacteroidota bacterium]|nr:hypothetical protein LBMAG25_19110 [Bacteroidota bacterium]
MWGSRVKIFLFIGIFLLLIGICAYGYLSYEGFQTSNSGSFCSVEQNKCANQCLSTKKDPGTLPNESPEESLLYEVYQDKNLSELISPSVPEPMTTVQLYDMASELSEFDPQAPMPWDYDNRQLDPKDTVWGDVHSNVSHMLYEKSYNRVLFGSADPATFIENDNDTGQNAYRSNVFQTTVYGTGAMAAITQAEAFQDFYTSMIIEEVLKEVGLTAADKRALQRIDAINSIREQSRPKWTVAGREVTKPFSNYTISYADAAKQVDLEMGDPVKVQNKVDSAIEAERGRITNLTIPASFKNADGTLKPAGQALLESRMNDLKQKVKVQELQGKSKTTAIRTSLEILNGDKWARHNMFFSKGGFKGKPIGTALRSVATGLRYVAGRLIQRATSSYIGKFVKKMFEYVIKIILAETVLTLACTKVMADAAAAAAQAAVPTLGVTLAVYAGWVASYSTSCGVAHIGLGAIMTSLITWIPVLMSQIVDEQISLCPPDAPWNLKDSFYNLPGGELGWELFSAIPVVGDISYAIGPYICWGAKDGKIISKLKQEIKSPYYYFDPTLSIYTADKKYALTADPNNPTVRNQITSGVFENSPEFTNHYLYKDKYGLYPIFVDFSHRVMLNKMAQFYYDTSRKNMTINYDGTGTFEYISKIYGIISSSELSCDIQCEISKITIDILHGTKLCEQIVPVPQDAPAWYHDRRFYFFVDITRGIDLSTDLNEKCEE